MNREQKIDAALNKVRKMRAASYKADAALNKAVFAAPANEMYRTFAQDRRISKAKARCRKAAEDLEAAVRAADDLEMER